jgi:TPR repeat protein
MLFNPTTLKTNSSIFRKSVLLPLTLAALYCLSPIDAAFAKTGTSTTIDGRVFTTVGGSQLTLAPTDDGAFIQIDGQVIEFGPATVEMNGETYATPANGQVRVEVSGTTIQVFVGDTLITSGEAPDQPAPYTLEQVQAFAAIGDPNAQNELAFAYQHGNGVEADLEKAVHYYRLAAEQGFARAQFNLGLMLERGTGVDADLDQARQWYERAAEQDNANAIAQLGVLYANGLGVEQDPLRAAEYYQRAADLGLAFAQLKLGVMYFNGAGIEQDQARAVQLFTLAAEQGDASSQHNLSVAYRLGQGVEMDDAMALSWLQKAAEQNLAVALNDLGARYMDGLGVAQDQAHAVELYEAAAAQGNALAMTNLGRAYRDGTGVELDLARSAEWFEQAIIGGNTDAAPLLADVNATREQAEMPPPVLPSFYVLRPDRTQTVLDDASLRAEIAAGTITETTYVWRSGMSDWQHAGNVEELTDLL